MQPMPVCSMTVLYSVLTLSSLTLRTARSPLSSRLPRHETLPGSGVKTRPKLRFLATQSRSRSQTHSTYDLTKSYGSAGLLAGVDHHTVRRYDAAREGGLDPTVAVERPKVSDPFADKIMEWIDRSQGRMWTDVVHARLVAMRYEGSERTTRRVVAHGRPSDGWNTGECSSRGCPSRHAKPRRNFTTLSSGGV